MILFFIYFLMYWNYVIMDPSVELEKNPVNPQISLPNRERFQPFVSSRNYSSVISFGIYYSFLFSCSFFVELLTLWDFVLHIGRNSLTQFPRLPLVVNILLNSVFCFKMKILISGIIGFFFLNDFTILCHLSYFTFIHIFNIWHSSFLNIQVAIWYHFSSLKNINISCSAGMLATNC